MAIYNESMAPGYPRWRTVHPQLLDALIAHSGVQARFHAAISLRRYGRQTPKWRRAPFVTYMYAPGRRRILALFLTRICHGSKT